MEEDTKVKCCFCDYSSTERGVEAHMGKAHKDILSRRQRVVGWGRLPKDACGRCGMIHQRIPRDGWMADRRKLERSGKIVQSAGVFGRIPQGYQGHGALGENGLMKPTLRSCSRWAWRNGFKLKSLY